MGAQGRSTARRPDVLAGRLTVPAGPGAAHRPDGAAGTGVQAVPPISSKGVATAVRGAGPAASRPAVEIAHLRKTYGPVVAVDVCWGAFVTAVSSALGLMIANWIAPRT